MQDGNFRAYGRSWIIEVIFYIAIAGLVKYIDRYIRDGAIKACHRQAAADPRGSRTCVCAITLVSRWHTQGLKGEFTSCRGTVLLAWLSTSSWTHGGKTGLPAKVSGRDVVRRRQSSLILEVRPGNRQGW